MFPGEDIRSIPSLNIPTLYLPLSVYVDDFKRIILVVDVPSCPFRTFTSDLGFDDMVIDDRTSSVCMHECAY